MNPPKLRAKYWYTDSRGRAIYSLPDNRSVCVRRLSDIVLAASYEKILLNKNPYIDEDYFQRRHDRKAIIGASGKYKEVWQRQQGLCYFCGRPILPDQPKDVVRIKPDGPALPSNFAYVHELCKAGELTVCEVLGDVSVYTSRELMDGAQEIVTALGPEPRTKLAGPLRENWMFQPLKKWFAQKDYSSVTLTESRMAEIDELLAQFADSGLEYDDITSPRNNRKSPDAERTASPFPDHVEAKRDKTAFCG